jgi:serine/threonine-protein kinase
VQVYDYGECSGIWFIVMELLEGVDLGKAIAGHRCGDFRAKLDIARQLAKALRHIHAAGIVHRDIKPANVFLEPSGRVKVMDFGIALAADNVTLTQTNALMGTPEYLPPERVNGQPATTASDIYALGLLLFELFTGTKAYEGNTAEVLYKIIHQSIPLERLHAAALPQPLIHLIRNTTAKSPNDRPQTMDLIIAELDVIAGESDAGPARAGTSTPDV